MGRSLIALAGLLLAGCSYMNSPDSEKPPITKATFGPWGIDFAFMDKSVKPGDDFFRYANGSWLTTTEIRPDRSYAGAILDLRMTSEERLKGIFADLAARDAAKLSAEERKIHDLYGAFTDEAAIEAAGLTPAQPGLDAIAAATTREDVAKLMGDPALGIDGPFNFQVGIDDKDANAYIIFLGQSGLNLPDRDYYLRADKELAATRTAYQNYLAGVLEMTGFDNAKKRAKAIYDLEVKMAKAHWPAEERRDADKIYNPMTAPALEDYARGFPWRVMLEQANVPLSTAKGQRIFIVAENTAFPKLAKIFAATPVSVWRDYMVTRYVHAHAAYLPKKFDDADFAFFGKALFGSQQQLERATRGTRLVDGAMGEAVGKIYVAKYFPPSAKAKAELLVSNLIKAYDEDIKQLDWMGDATKEKALYKLHKIMLKIGYPDQFRDYSALEIKRGDLVGNVQRARVFEWNRKLKRIDEPVDRTEWAMSASTVNAYYNASLNEIVFPAGILQAPLFDVAADDAVNYGALGGIIGHEISHGFDDQGSKYDGDGILKNWWTDEDRKNFDARSAALAGQFDKFEPLPGIHLNGKLTLGENIADLAGLAIAQKAYHLSLNGKPAPVLDGYTADQRFYLGYSAFHREKMRDGRLRAIVLSDPHSPDEFRVNGALPNMDSWYSAYDVKEGEKLFIPPDKRVRLW